MTVKLAQIAMICAVTAAPAFAQDAAAPSYDWTGPYVGLNYTSATYFFTSGTFEAENDFKGPGVQLGYLVDRGALVFGAELSYAKLALNDAFEGEGATSTSARALVGYSIDKALLYAAGGMGKVEFFDDFGPIDGDSGPVVGIGARYAVTERVSVGLDYSKLMIKEYDGGNASVDGEFVSFGVNYKF